jgi:hypothetical protein
MSGEAERSAMLSWSSVANSSLVQAVGDVVHET